MAEVEVKIFFDESGKKSDRPTTMGGLLIPKKVYENTEIQKLNSELKAKSLKYHWTGYSGYKSEREEILNLILCFTKYSSLCTVNIINYIKPDKLKAKDFENMIYTKLPERILYGLLRHRGHDTNVISDVLIEEATEYAKIQLKEKIREQLNIQAIYRGQRFQIQECNYYKKNEEIGVELTDLILGFTRTIIKNNYECDSKAHIAKTKLVVELLKIDSFYSFLSKINYFEWTNASELKQIDFSNYIRMFLSQQSDWIGYLGKSSSIKE